MSNRPVSWVKLEEDAYYAVLRALAVNELNWEKEKLLTDLRTILHITNDQHFKFLEEVMGDKLVTKLRESQRLANNKAKSIDAAPANPMPPPPPRQLTPATQAGNARKTSRPGSAGAKGSGNPAGPARQHRLSEPTLSGKGRLRGVSGAELKRNSTGSARPSRGLNSQRSRGRGRRISTLPREKPAQAAELPRAKRKMFSQEYIEKLIASGSEEDVKAVYAELEAQIRSVDHHSSLITQLEETSLAETDPAKYCQLAIEELEMADEMYEAEEKLLQAYDDDAKQD